MKYGIVKLIQIFKKGQKNNEVDLKDTYMTTVNTLNLIKKYLKKILNLFFRHLQQFMEMLKEYC